MPLLRTATHYSDALILDTLTLGTSTEGGLKLEAAFPRVRRAEHMVCADARIQFTDLRLILNVAVGTRIIDRLDAAKPSCLDISSSVTKRQTLTFLRR